MLRPRTASWLPPGFRLVTNQKGAIIWGTAQPVGPWQTQSEHRPKANRVGISRSFGGSPASNVKRVTVVSCLNITTPRADSLKIDPHGDGSTTQEEKQGDPCLKLTKHRLNQKKKINCPLSDNPICWLLIDRNRRNALPFKEQSSQSKIALNESHPTPTHGTHSELLMPWQLMI